MRSMGWIDSARVAVSSLNGLMASGPPNFPCPDLLVVCYWDEFVTIVIDPFTEFVGQELMHRYLAKG